MAPHPHVAHNFVKYEYCCCVLEVKKASYIDDAFLSPKRCVDCVHHTGHCCLSESFSSCCSSQKMAIRHAFINENELTLIIMKWIINNTKLFARGNLINQTIKINRWHVEVNRTEKSHCDALLFLPSFWFNFKDAERYCSVIRFQLCKYAASSQKCCYSWMLWPT